MTQAIAEKPTTTTTVSGAAGMQIANREAEARAALPVTPRQAAPLKPAPHPRQAALMAEADAIRQEASQAATRADNLTVQARVTGQRIGNLETERTGILQRLANIGENDLKSKLAANRARIHQLYGKPTLTGVETNDLNLAVASLAWFPLLEKEVVVIKKDLQTRLEKVEAQLAELTAPST